ncbi:MAG: ABC transporter ATP-binding protein [Mycobacteriales bacterium]
MTSGSPETGTAKAAPAPAAGESPAPTVAPLAIETTGLTKRFRGGQVAVDHLNLRVPHGAVYGFLGPNGSGKTTTIRMLLGLISATEGSHELFGTPMTGRSWSLLSHVGALVEGPAAYGHLSGAANLARYDAGDRTADPVTAKARIDVALERVGLTAARGKKVRNYSLGMKQRLGIAAALLQPRRLLVLDEPTNGLDPQGTREVRTLVGSLADDGTTVLVSSHLLAEVEQMCTHVGVMHAGRLLKQGSLDEMRAGQQASVRITTPDPARAVEVLSRLGFGHVLRQGSEISAPYDGVAIVPEKVNAALVQAGVGVRALAVDEPTLEDMFVALTGEGFDVSG